MAKQITVLVCPNCEKELEHYCYDCHRYGERTKRDAQVRINRYRIESMRDNCIMLQDVETGELHRVFVNDMSPILSGMDIGHLVLRESNKGNERCWKPSRP